MTAEQSGLAVSRRAFLQGLGLTTAATAAHHLIAHADEPAPPPPILPEPQAPTSVPSAAVVALNRMAFGPRPGDVAAFNALGATDEERLTTYVDQQLNPQAIPDTDLETRLAAANTTTLGKSLTQLWQEHVVDDWLTRTDPIRESERIAFVRAIYSKRQLQEVLADFWYNHFNVKGWHWWVAPLFVHYDRDVIRPHTLGNFRQMLEAVAKSPAMLFYLNNAFNTRAGPNENFARELFELHTLGAENYKGVQDPDSVPRDNNNIPIGYVDEDVYEATRCFTGWTVNNSNGSFAYEDSDHDRFRKDVLGVRLPPDQAPLKDGHDVLDLVAFHPGTARHVCRKLCRQLIGDSPPEAIVLSAAQLFIQHQQSPDQLKRVVRHILLSDVFRTTWGQKLKRPFESIVSAMRATNTNWTIRPNHAHSDSFMWLYLQTGQPLYDWPSPDGYPDEASAWQGTNPLVMRWRLINWFTNLQDEANNFYADLFGQTPVGVRSAEQLANFWCDRIFGYQINSQTRTALAQFMAQGSALDVPLNLDNAHIAGRFRMMVATILLTPEFHLR